jgi:hypothetical protein
MSPNRREINSNLVYTFQRRPNKLASTLKVKHACILFFFSLLLNIYVRKMHARKHSCLHKPIDVNVVLWFLLRDCYMFGCKSSRATLTLGDGSRRLGVETDDQGEHWDENSTTSDPSNATQCCAKESYY